MHKFPVINDGIVLHLRSRLSSWATAKDPRADLSGAYNVRVSDVTKALDRLLDSLSTEARVRRDGGQAHHSHVNADVIPFFQELTYRLAEAFDLFRRLSVGWDLTKCNKQAVREYKKVIKRVARTACLICNKIKHENCVLSRVDTFYDAGYYVEGFVLLSRGRNATLEINRDLHQANKPGMSFNLGVRSIVFDFLRADVAAGRLCSTLGAGESELPDVKLVQSLRLLSSRPEIGLRFEVAHSVPSVWEQRGYWVIGRKVRDLPAFQGKAQVIQSITGDGYTRTFPIAG